MEDSEDEGSLHSRLHDLGRRPACGGEGTGKEELGGMTHPSPRFLPTSGSVSRELSVEKPLLAARGLIEGLMPIAGVCVWLSAMVSEPTSPRRVLHHRGDGPSPSAAGASPRPRFLYRSGDFLPSSGTRGSWSLHSSFRGPDGAGREPWQESTLCLFSVPVPAV